MDTEYWLQRWREGRTGWHHEKPMPLLIEHWPALDVARGARVLVPLCGKTPDMLWLSQQGLQVLGTELSAIAVELFLAENHLHARVEAAIHGTCYHVSNAPDGGDIDIVNGDMFEVPEADITGCQAFYDRAAIIALPAAQRERLVREVYAKLPAGSRGLVITLDYPHGEMQGPPFSVAADEVHRLFGAHWDIRQLDRRDILASQPSFSEAGVTALHTAVYALARRDA